MGKDLIILRLSVVSAGDMLRMRFGTLRRIRSIWSKLRLTMPYFRLLMNNYMYFV